MRPIFTNQMSLLNSFNPCKSVSSVLSVVRLPLFNPQFCSSGDFGNLCAPVPYTSIRIPKELYDSTPEVPWKSCSDQCYLCASVVKLCPHPPGVIPDWRRLERCHPKVIPDWRGVHALGADWRWFAQISVIRVNQW